MLTFAIKNGVHRIAPQWTKTTVQTLRLCREAIRLREKCSHLSSLEDVVDEVFHNPYFPASQKKTEILDFLRLLKELQPKCLCEIGAFGGGTLSMFCHVAAPDAKILSIDLNYTFAQLMAYPYFARHDQRVTCLAADSHSELALGKVRKWLDGQQFDCIFIDGDHSFSGVSSDYSLYAPHVLKGGIVAFHDIVPDFMTRYGIATGSYVGEVPAFWHDLKLDGRKTCELIGDPHQDGYGIGIVTAA